MKTTVQTVSDIEVRIDVEIPTDTVNREYNKQLRRFGKRARVKGFRAGKAPRAMVKKQFGPTIAQETTRQLIEDSFSDVLTGLDRSTIGEPKLEPGLAKEGEPMTYAIRVQVKPIIELHSWEKIEVEAAPATISESALNERLNALREEHKERVAVEDRGADTGDVVVCGFEGYLEGERDLRLDGNDVELKLGAGQMIPGFEDGLMGAKTGEPAQVETTFPEDYHSADLAGKEARWDVTIEGVYSEELPALDDDFAQDLDHDDLATLSAYEEAKLIATAEESRKREVETKVMDVVLERNQFQVPPALIEAYANDRARNMAWLFQMQGMPQDQAVKLVNGNMDNIIKQAEVAARRYLALEALALEKELEPSDDDLGAEIAKRIEDQGEKVADTFAKPEAREGLAAEMAHQKALQLIVDTAIVVDAAPVADASEAADSNDDAPNDADAETDADDSGEQG